MKKNKKKNNLGFILIGSWIGATIVGSILGITLGIKHSNSTQPPNPQIEKNQNKNSFKPKETENIDKNDSKQKENVSIKKEDVSNENNANNNEIIKEENTHNLVFDTKNRSVIVRDDERYGLLIKFEKLLNNYKINNQLYPYFKDKFEHFDLLTNEEINQIIGLLEKLSSTSILHNKVLNENSDVSLKSTDYEKYNVLITRFVDDSNNVDVKFNIIDEIIPTINNLNEFNTIYNESFKYINDKPSIARFRLQPKTSLEELKNEVTNINANTLWLKIHNIIQELKSYPNDLSSPLVAFYEKLYLSHEHDENNDYLQPFWVHINEFLLNNNYLSPKRNEFDAFAEISLLEKLKFYHNNYYLNKDDESNISFYLNKFDFKTISFKKKQKYDHLIELFNSLTSINSINEFERLLSSNSQSEFDSHNKFEYFKTISTFLNQLPTSYFKTKINFENVDLLGWNKIKDLSETKLNELGLKSFYDKLKSIFVDYQDYDNLSRPFIFNILFTTHTNELEQKINAFTELMTTTFYDKYYDLSERSKHQELMTKRNNIIKQIDLNNLDTINVQSINEFLNEVETFKTQFKERIKNINNFKELRDIIQSVLYQLRKENEVIRSYSYQENQQILDKNENHYLYGKIVEEDFNKALEIRKLVQSKLLSNLDWSTLEQEVLSEYVDVNQLTKFYNQLMINANELDKYIKENQLNYNGSMLFGKLYDNNEKNLIDHFNLTNIYNPDDERLDDVKINLENNLEVLVNHNVILNPSLLVNQKIFSNDEFEELKNAYDKVMKNIYFEHATKFSYYFNNLFDQDKYTLTPSQINSLKTYLNLVFNKYTEKYLLKNTPIIKQDDYDPSTKTTVTLFNVRAPKFIDQWMKKIINDNHISNLTEFDLESIRGNLTQYIINIFDDRVIEFRKRKDLEEDERRLWLNEDKTFTWVNEEITTKYRMRFNEMNVLYQTSDKENKGVEYINNINQMISDLLNESIMVENMKELLSYIHNLRLVEKTFNKTLIATFNFVVMANKFNNSSYKYLEEFLDLLLKRPKTSTNYAFIDRTNTSFDPVLSFKSDSSNNYTIKPHEYHTNWTWGYNFVRKVLDIGIFNVENRNRSILLNTPIEKIKDLFDGFEENKSWFYEWINSNKPRDFNVFEFNELPNLNVNENVNFSKIINENYNEWVKRYENQNFEKITK